MSHFSLMAIGFKNEAELEQAMEPYSENISVAPYVSKTKEELLKEGKEKYAERCQIIADFDADYTAALNKHGAYGEDIYLKKDDKKMIVNEPDPNKYYEFWAEGETLNENGDIMTTYNPNSKWDYWDIEETMKVSRMKKMKQDYKRFFSPAKYERIWDIVVNGEKPNSSEFMLVWGQPRKEDMISLYKTKEEFVEHFKNNFAPAYCVLTPSGWYEPGTVGYWGMSSAKPKDEYEFRKNFFKRFVDPYTDSTTVYFIDCHI